jgi:hypothetical protein
MRKEGKKQKKIFYRLVLDFFILIWISTMYILAIKGRFICLCNRYYNVIYCTIIYAANISGGVVVVDDDSACKKNVYANVLLFIVCN